MGNFTCYLCGPLLPVTQKRRCYTQDKLATMKHPRQNKAYRNFTTVLKAFPPW